MSMPLSNVDREAQLRALLAEFATKVEASAAAQARLLGDKELGVRNAISSCVREIVLRRQRAGFLMKLGITLTGVPAGICHLRHLVGVACEPTYVAARGSIDGSPCLLSAHCPLAASLRSCSTLGREPRRPLRDAAA